MGKKSSNKPSKAGQATRTEANKRKHKALMTELYVKAHGSQEGMPNWDERPDYTPHKQKVVIETMLKKNKTS